MKTADEPDAGVVTFKSLTYGYEIHCKGSKHWKHHKTLNRDIIEGPWDCPNGGKCA